MKSELTAELHSILGEDASDEKEVAAVKKQLAKEVTAVRKQIVTLLAKYTRKLYGPSRKEVGDLLAQADNVLRQLHQLLPATE